MQVPHKGGPWGRDTWGFNPSVQWLANRGYAVLQVNYRGSGGRGHWDQFLAYLAHNAGRVVTQDLLLEHVWGSEYLGESHMLQVNINRLRRKIEADPTHPRYLLTKVGIGYLLAAHPEVHVAE